MIGFCQADLWERTSQCWLEKVMYSSLLVSSGVAFCRVRVLYRLALAVKMIAPLHIHNHLVSSHAL